MKPLPNNIFFEDITNRIAEGKSVIIRAKGNSMLPFIKDKRDELILKSHEGLVKKGMILLARKEDGHYVIHRVIEMNDTNVILRGDGNICGTEVCSKSNIIAKVTAVNRNGKKITEGSFFWNLFEWLWPRNNNVRRILLAAYRRIY